MSEVTAAKAPAPKRAKKTALPSSDSAAAPTVGDATSVTVVAAEAANTPQRKGVRFCMASLLPVPEKTPVVNAENISDPPKPESQPKKPRKPKESKTDVTKSEEAEATTASATAAVDTAALKPEPKAKKPRGKAASAAAAPELCSECGTSAPFCAMTGKPHQFQKPCPLCNLRSAFCAQTGEKHLVMYGGTAVAAVAADQATASKATTSRKKTRSDDTKTPAVALDAATSPSPSKKARSEPSVVVGEMPNPNAAAPSAAAPKQRAPPRKRQKTLDEINAAAVVGDVNAPAPIAVSVTAPMPPQQVKEPLPPPPPQPFQYPPLRPVLSKVEQTLFLKQVLPNDPAIKATMEKLDVTSVTAQKRFLAFIGQYATEKTKMEMNKAFRASQPSPVMPGKETDNAAAVAAESDQNEVVEIVDITATPTTATVEVE